ncbi:hypothetical protein AAW12_15120 [Sphingobacterium sp. Ag1]|uniref:hypothetical protein n=1 Tax=Sphingobacterium sp. Ag1 TaxID=1643451 RepID=UPI00062821DD|nr:hypothetical protein [Sphingobacterium sp. Ag1]KKO90431.1 hypothetical protein AAW12_15120 [Sphingobacterium sp. Ag1]
MNNWLTDFVFVPIIIHFSSIIGSFVFNNNKAHGYPLYQIWTISLLASILFEWIMPKYTSYNTGDIIDVLAYFAGGLFYFYIHQPLYVSRNLPSPPPVNREQLLTSIQTQARRPKNTML